MVKYIYIILVGHLSYQCRNNFKLKNSQNKTDAIPSNIDNNNTITQITIDKKEGMIYYLFRI
jgi:hypothetical protein